MTESRYVDNSKNLSSKYEWDRPSPGYTSSMPTHTRTVSDKYQRNFGATRTNYVNDAPSNRYTGGSSNGAERYQYSQNKYPGNGYEQPVMARGRLGHQVTAKIHGKSSNMVESIYKDRPSNLLDMKYGGGNGY